MGVQDEKNAGHLLCAQGVQKLRGKRYQQSIALFAAVIQRVQRDIAAFQQLLGGGGDLVAQPPKILRVPQDLLHIAGAVAHPMVSRSLAFSSSCPVTLMARMLAADISSSTASTSIMVAKIL